MVRCMQRNKQEKGASPSPEDACPYPDPDRNPGTEIQEDFFRPGGSFGREKMGQIK